MRLDSRAVHGGRCGMRAAAVAAGDRMAVKGTGPIDLAKSEEPKWALGHLSRSDSSKNGVSLKLDLQGTSDRL